MTPEPAQTETTDPQKHISMFGYGLLGEIVSDSEPADLPLPRYLVYSKLKAIENARTKLIYAVESDVLRAENGITAEDEKLLETLNTAEINMRAAYERLEDVWSIYTNLIDGFMYMRAMREVYHNPLNKLNNGTINAKPAESLKTEMPENRYE